MCGYADNVPMCVDNVPMCVDNVPMCVDNVPMCSYEDYRVPVFKQFPMCGYVDNVPMCVDNVPMCVDNVPMCGYVDNVPMRGYVDTNVSLLQVTNVIRVQTDRQDPAATMMEPIDPSSPNLDGDFKEILQVVAVSAPLTTPSSQ